MYIIDLLIYFWYIIEKIIPSSTDSHTDPEFKPPVGCYFLRFRPKEANYNGCRT